MASSSVRPDYLRLHANVSRRVRNLETGVHPTSTEGGFEDTIAFTAVAVNTTYFNHFQEGVTIHALAWQRHNRVITLAGGVEPAGTWATIPTTARAGTLPANARPIREMFLNGAMDGTPWLFQYRVQTNGEIWITRPTSTGEAGCRFEGANWTVT